MSRGDKNLDELFKTALQPQEHEVVPAYWQEAQQMINASKVATTPFYLKPFFIAGALLVTASISVFLFFGSTPDKQLAENTAIGINQGNTALLISKTQSTNQNLTASSEKTTKSNQKESELTTPTNNELEGKVSNTETSSTEKVAAKHKTSQANSFAKKWESTSFTPTPKSTKKLEPLNVSSSAMEVSDSPALPLNDGNTQKPTTVSYNPTIENKESQGYALKTAAEAIPFMTSKPWHELTVDEELAVPQSIKESKHKKLYNPFSLRLSAGALWEGQNSSTHSLVIAESKEQNIELSVEYLFHKRWGVQSGISWNQIQTNQSFSYLEEIDNSYWTTEQNVNTVINRVWWLGDWYYYPNIYDTTYDDVYVFLKDSVAQNTQLESKMTLIEVPILLTYNYAWNRINVQLASGISLGTVVHASGSYFSSNDPFAQEINSRNDFPSLQTSFLFHSEFAYGLNENWWLTARPQIKWNLNSIAPNNATISPKVFYYGVNAGLMYRF